MALLSVIRRWYFREGMPIREIERRTGLSRNTIRKYLRAGTVEPKFKVPHRPSKLDSYAEKLAGWLKSEAARPRKQRPALAHRGARQIGGASGTASGEVSRVTSAFLGTGDHRALPPVRRRSGPLAAMGLRPNNCSPISGRDSLGFGAE